MKTKFIFSILLALLLALSGCSTKKENQFEEDQEGITTPHGEIDPTSVKEREDDHRIAYTTKDGKHWTTDFKLNADGKRVWEQPKPDRGF